MKSDMERVMPDTNREVEDSPSLSIKNLPRTVAQALYHSLTGKTENLSKILKDNVIIDQNNIDNLRHKINQQLEHYDLLSDPIVTVAVKHEEDKTLHYTSWERFKHFQENSSEITSEFILKFEFALKLPNTDSLQRYSLNISMDSGLPIVANRKEDVTIENFFDIIFFAQEWKTVHLSIDYVDFLVAKILLSIVEEWFSNLDRVPKPKWTSFVYKRMGLFNDIFSQFTRLGVATFLSSYVWFNKGVLGDIGKLVYAVSVATVVWAIMSVLSSYSRNKFNRRIQRCIVPSVILISNKDYKEFDIVKQSAKNSYKGILNVVTTSVFAVLVNLFSSYLYSYLHG